MRTVYLGTSEFAADILRGLAESAHRPELVVTRPDRPRGRGRRLAPPPVADLARELELPLDQPESVNGEEALARIAAVEPEAVCVCAFGALIREPLLSAYPILNVHPSLLPRWRGAAPIERAIMAGDDRTGVSIMRLTAGLDSGPVCRQQALEIAPGDDYGTLSARLAGLGGELLVATLSEPGDCTEQDDAAATYAEKLTAADRHLDPARPALELERVVRALRPHIGANLALADGSLLGVRDARVADAAAPVAGQLDTGGEYPVLGCTPGALELRVVQPPGKRPMDGAAYLRGHRA
jgi:methionyl-tRNA formyltransferase